MRGKALQYTLAGGGLAGGGGTTGVVGFVGRFPLVIPGDSDFHISKLSLLREKGKGRYSLSPFIVCCVCTNHPPQECGEEASCFSSLLRFIHDEARLKKGGN